MDRVIAPETLGMHELAPLAEEPEPRRPSVLVGPPAPLHSFAGLALDRAPSVAPTTTTTTATATDYAALDRQLSPSPGALVRDKAPKAIYDMLGPTEKWREHVDAAHHVHGKNVYVKGLHGHTPDPNYNRAMMDADRHIRSTFGRPLTFDDYDRTHTLAMPDKTDAFAANFRRGELPIGTRENRFNSPQNELEAENVAPFGGTAHVPPLVSTFAAAKAATPQDDGRAKITLADVVQGGNAREVYKGHVNGLLGAYYERVGQAKNTRQKLGAIAHLHKSLENLHPYGDANTRTNRLVLNRMLAEQGLPLTMLDRPLDVHHTKEADWVKHIVRGQRAWGKAVASRPSDSPVATEWSGWETGVKNARFQHDAMPNSIIKQETPKPTALESDAPELSAYSNPVAKYVAPVEQPEPALDRNALLAYLRPKVALIGGMSADALDTMSTENLADMKRFF